MAPSILVLQRHLRDSTSTAPQTPHEARFRAKFLVLLREACSALREPNLADIAGFEQAFEPLRAVTRALGDEYRCGR